MIPTPDYTIYIIMSLNTVFTATGICYTTCVDITRQTYRLVYQNKVLVLVLVFIYIP